MASEFANAVMTDESKAAPPAAAAAATAEPAAAPAGTAPGPVPEIHAPTPPAGAGAGAGATAVAAAAVGQAVRRASLRAMKGVTHDADLAGPVNSLAAEDKAMQFDSPGHGTGTGQRRRRACRIISMCCCAGTAIGLFFLIVIASSIRQTVVFDPANEFALSIRGCNVHVVSGSVSTVKVERWLGRQSTHTVSWNIAGDAAIAFKADNPGGCDALFFDCDLICQVIVTVDKENPPAFLLVQQLSDDAADHVHVTVEPGVTMQGFKVAGPSADVTIRDATFTGSLTVRGQGGTVSVTDTSFASADLRALKGSVYVTHTKPIDYDYNVLYRNLGSNTCFASRSNTGTVQERIGWSSGYSAWSECNLDSQWWGHKTVTHYDANSDFMITTTELQEGLTKLNKCCGSACPFRSLCGSYSLRLFPTATTSTNDLSSRSGIITDSEFLSRIKAINDTTIVPFCLAEADVKEPSHSASRTLKIYAESGEMRVRTTSMEWDEPLKPDNKLEGKSLNTSFVAPSGNMPGLRLLAGDAERLMADIRDKVGHTDATGDLFAVIDVVESPGVPAGRWIYTTRPFYLVLDPANLEFLTAGLLMPPIQQYRVHFTNGYCHENATRYDPDTGKLIDHEAREIEIFKQLQTAVTPRFQLETRGVLLLVGPDHRPAPQRRDLAYFQKDYVTGEVRKAAFKTSNDVWTAIAVYLSIGIGCLLALIATIGFLVYMRHALRQKQKADSIKRRLMLMQVEGRTGVKLEKTEAESAMENRSFNPFETPLELIELMLINPLRKRVVNSLDKFVRERMRRHKPQPSNSAKVAAEHPSVPFVTLDQFVEAYSRFCYMYDLSEVQDRKAIQRHLVAKHDVRVKGVRISQLRGLRWRQDIDILAAIQQLHASTHGVNEPEKVDVEPTDEDLLMDFLAVYCIVSRDVSADFVEYENNGKNMGFRHTFELYCEARGWAAPETDLPHEVYRRNGLKLINRRRMMLTGLVPIDFAEGGRAQLGCRWYGIEYCTVVLHMILMFVLPIFIMFKAMDMQYMYAKTMAAGSAITYYDIMQVSHDFSGKHIMISVEVIMLTMFTFMGLAIIRMFIHYVDLPSKIFNMLIRKSFAFILTIMLFSGFTWLGVVVMWFLLGAILDPTKFLPYGAAILTIGVVMVATWKTLYAAAVALRRKFAAVMQVHLNDTMKKARQMLLDQARLDRQRQGQGILRRRARQINDESEVEVDENTEFEVADVFSLLNSDGDAVLTHEEFDSLFIKLQLNISQRKKEQMFAYCDMDGSGTISQEEFVDAWNWVQEQMMLEAAESIGLSDGAIAIAVFTIVFMLILIFAFLLIAIRAWSNAGSFDSVIQSFLVMGTGKLVSAVKNKPKSPEELDELVDDIVEGQQNEPLPDPN